MDESRHEEKRALLGESKNDRDVVDAKERPKKAGGAGAGAAACCQRHVSA